MSIKNEDPIRLVAVVNKRIEQGVAMNALFHMGAGITNLLSDGERDQLNFLDFKDAAGHLHPSISGCSFIVLRAKQGEIAKLRRQADELGLKSVGFLESMTGDTYVEQLARTEGTRPDDLEYYGLALFGTKSTLTPLTSKLSLWK